MISGLAGTVLFSPDHTKLVPFYRDTLGLHVTDEMNGMVFFGTQFLVGTHSELNGPAKEPERQIPTFQTDDIRADYARLKAKGVVFHSEPAQIGPVLQVTLRDPDGNFVNLIQFLEGA